MTIIYQNPLREVKDPTLIMLYVGKATDPDLTYQDSCAVISWLKGAIQVHDKDGHKVAVAFMRQAILRCKQLQRTEVSGGF